MGVLEDQVVDLILNQSAVEDVVASYADVLRAQRLRSEAGY